MEASSGKVTPTGEQYCHVCLLNSSKQETEMMKSRELGYFQGSDSKVPTVFSNNFTISTISFSFQTEQLDRMNDRCEDQFQK